MNPTILGNVLIWSLFLAVLGGIITVASVAYEAFIGRRWLNRGAKRVANVAPVSLARLRPNGSAPQNAMIRGYDSEELFQEDLWLLRIAQSRRQAGLPEPLLPAMETSNGVREKHLSHVCALLAHHANVRCDN
jgi:hypothetical protein